jgi:chromosome segregation ATPase
MNLPSDTEVYTKNFKYYPYIPIKGLEKKQKEYYEKNINKIKNLYVSPLRTSSLSTPLTISPQKIECETPESAYNAITFEENTTDTVKEQEQQEKQDLHTQIITEQQTQIADNEVTLHLQKTTIETNELTIKEKQDRIHEFDIHIKKQEFAMEYNKTISDQIVQNINSLNKDLINKSNVLLVINKQINDAYKHMEDLQNKITNSQTTIQSLEANIYNYHNELSYHQNMIGQIHNMVQNPEYMMATMIECMSPNNLTV